MSVSSSTLEVMVWLIQNSDSCPAGPQALAIHQDNAGPVGEIELRLCHHCRDGVLEHIRIAEGHRRQGLASEALRTLFAKYRDYHWSAVAVADSDPAHGFWSAVSSRIDGLNNRLAYCTHMSAAEDLLGCE